MNCKKEVSYFLFLFYVLMYPLIFSIFSMFKGSFDFCFFLIFEISFFIVGSILYYFSNDKSFKKIGVEKMYFLNIFTSFIVLFIFLFYVIIFEYIIK